MTSIKGRYQELQRHEAAVQIAHCWRLEWDHPISQMIRNGENDEALDLLEGLDLLETDDYREPVKKDFHFQNSIYRTIKVEASTILDVDGGRAYKNAAYMWAVERWSPRYDWSVVTQQILPYHYEPIHFRLRARADEFKAELEDAESGVFDGMRAYENQDPRRFKPDFFPKD